VLILYGPRPVDGAYILPRLLFKLLTRPYFQFYVEFQHADLLDDHLSVLVSTDFPFDNTIIGIYR